MAARFELHATEQDSPTQDIEYLNLKFNQLYNSKKPTGDPPCPPNVPLAKNIARDILYRVHVSSVGTKATWKTPIRKAKRAVTERGTPNPRRSGKGRIGELMELVMCRGRRAMMLIWWSM